MNEALGPFTLVLLLIPAAALRFAVGALYGRQQMAATDPMRMVLSLTSSILVLLAGLGVVIGMVGVTVFLIPLPFCS